LRIPRALAVLASGCAVYFVMAACSSLPLIGDDDEDNGRPGAPGANADGSSSSSSSSSGSPVPNAMAGEWHKGGSRLKLRYLKGDDGTQQFLGWSDSARGGEDCSFLQHADGSWRCMPTATALVGGYFASASCTGTELVYLAKGLPAPKYGQKYEGLGTRRYPVTKPHAGAVYWRQPTTGACQDVSSLSTSSDVYAVGPELPPSAFVLGTLTTSP